MRNRGFSILSIEAKDLIAAMDLQGGNAGGYNIRNKHEQIILRKFENTLDWSLDTIKLQEEYEKATRSKNFYFVVNKRKYTQVVINVKFSYSYKQFNKAGWMALPNTEKNERAARNNKSPKGVYVRAGYDLKACDFTDGVCIRDGQLVGIQVNMEVKNTVPEDLLPPYFAYIDGCYRQAGAIPVIKSKADLRRELYENGFVCDGIKYVRYKRSAGSSRVGKCLFVNEIVAKRIARRDKCGLSIRNNAPIDLASYEAYIALPMSSIINTMVIEPENILIVDDFYSSFKDKVIAVEEQNGRLIASEKEVDITNCIWDGESLLDVSMFGEYENKGMVLLRNRFFKTCAFNTNLQQWFADNGITSVSQLNGFTLAKDVSQIKLITTPSSVKYLKFGSMEDWLANLDNVFGVVKCEKETQYFNGRMVQCHYQLLNTLQLGYKDVEELLAPSLAYIGAIRRDPAVLRYHVGFSLKNEADESLQKAIKTKNEVVYKLLGINDKFCRTKIYKEFRDDIVKSFFRNLKRGHILLNGNYSTLLGNGLELLKYSIGTFDGTSEIGKGNMHSHRFAYGETMLGSRSPHVTMGNILLARNVANADIDKYFNMGNEIVYINSIGENILQRLSGADMDSDTVLLTNNQILIEAARKNYSSYLVPTNCVSAKKTKRHYNSKDKADLDIKTSVNKIGEIVNLSQQLNSLYWALLKKGKTLKENEELYWDVCKLDVLSGIEIDKAKKEFAIDSGKELNHLRKKYRIEEDNKTVKPMFFKMITTENGYKLSPKTTYRYFETPMDYLRKIVASANYRQARLSNIDTIPLMDIVKKPETKCGYYSTVRDNIIDEIKRCKKRINEVYIGYEERDKQGKQITREVAAQIKQECINIIDKMSLHEYLMYLVLKEIDKKENRAIKKLLFEVVFGKPDGTFMRMIENSKETIYTLVESADGTEKYYGFSFKRIASS